MGDSKFIGVNLYTACTTIALVEYVFTLGRESLGGSFGEFVAAETNARDIHV